MIDYEESDDFDYDEPEECQHGVSFEVSCSDCKQGWREL